MSPIGLSFRRRQQQQQSQIHSSLRLYLLPLLSHLLRLLLHFPLRLFLSLLSSFRFFLLLLISLFFDDVSPASLSSPFHVAFGSIDSDGGVEDNDIGAGGGEQGPCECERLMSALRAVHADFLRFAEQAQAEAKRLVEVGASVAGKWMDEGRDGKMIDCLCKVC